MKTGKMINKEERTVLVCSDRDGTINYDENYYLGASPDWKEQVKLQKGVVEGIRLINSIKNSEFFIITNQAGVALQGGEFDDLTMERMNEVNNFILKKLEENGVRAGGVFSCPFVDSNYVKKSIERGRRVNPEFVKDNHPDLKPNTGMIEKAANKVGRKLEECRVYVIGDRMSDVEMALKAGGVGILIESEKTAELKDTEKARILARTHPGRVYLARDFLEGAGFIKNNL
jgi:histidinol-phosphate phosphatase family protein